MRKILCLAISLLLVLSFVGCQSTDTLKDAATNYFAEYPGSRIIPWADVKAKLDAGDNLFILDTRSKADYDASHIKGAYQAGFGTDLANKVSMLPKDKPVYVYCYSGQTAGQQIALMNLLGVEAYSIQSGFNNGISKAEGYEAYLETTVNEMPDAKASFDKDVLKFVQDYFNTIPEKGNNIIAADAAWALIEAGDAVVLDIRRADDFAAGHIQGATNVPFGANMQEKFNTLPTDKKIVVACYSGQTSGQTISIMKALGYDAVSLQSGMGAGWVEKGFAVVQ